MLKSVNINLKPCVPTKTPKLTEQNIKKRQSYPIETESDNSSEDDDPIVLGYEGYQPLRRSTRLNKGMHSNIHHLPR